MKDPRAVDGRGRPRPIPYQASRGPSFVALAEKTTLEVRPRALLDGLVAAGAAEVRPDDTVVLTRTAYQPRRGRPEALAMVEDDPAELIETMLHNVLDADEDAVERRLQQKIAYDNLGSEGMAALRRALRREAERFLARVDRILSRHDRDRNPRAPGGERRYAGIGIHFFERSADRAAPRSSRRKKRKEGES